MPPTEPAIAWKRLLSILAVPALGGWLFGYDIGSTSFVLKRMMTESTQHDSSWYSHLTSIQQGLLVAAISLGALLGSHWVLHRPVLSRKRELQFAACSYVTGNCLNIVAGTVLSRYSIGFLCLFAGRTLFGVGVGLCMHGAPTYMAEMSPTSIRGAVVSSKETLIVLGIVTGYWIGDLVHHWVNLYAVSLFCSVPMWIGTTLIPQSKRYLILQGRDEEAKQSMQCVYKGNIDQEFKQLLKDSRSPFMAQSSRVDDTNFNRLFQPNVRPAMTAALGLMILQQFSGQPSILSYITLLLDEAHWSGHATVVAALIMLCVSSLTVSLVERLGRKTLLLVSATILMLGSLSLSILFWSTPYSFNSFQEHLILFSTFAYIGGYQAGFGPLSWVIVSEVFPGDLRGPGTAICVEANFILNFLVQFLIPVSESYLGWGKTFGVFAVIMGVGLHFIVRNIPETTGKTLEEIERHLSSFHERDETKTNETTPLVRNNDATL